MQRYSLLHPKYRNQQKPVHEPDRSVYAECFAKPPSPSLVSNHGDRRHTVQSKIPKQIGSYLTFYFSRDGRHDTDDMWLQLRVFVASYWSTWLHVQMCKTCWEAQKEFLLCLLSIPHETSLPEPALRLAPSLRDTQCFWGFMFGSGHRKTSKNTYTSPDAVQPWAMTHLLYFIIGVICLGF